MTEKNHFWDRSVIGGRERDGVTCANGGVVRIRLCLRKILLIHAIEIEIAHNKKVKAFKSNNHVEKTSCQWELGMMTEEQQKEVNLPKIEKGGII